MKSELVSKIITVTSAMFFVWCLVSIDNSLINIQRTNQKMELSKQGLASISPESLPMNVEILQYSIPLQDHSIPPDAITKLPAWAKFQEAVSAYTRKVKLLEQQTQELDEHLQRRTLWVSIAGTVTVLLNLYLIFRFRRRAGDTAKTP